MNFSFLSTNLFEYLSFKKNYYFKTKPFLVKENLSSIEYFLLDRFIQHHKDIQNPQNWSVDKESKTAFFLPQEKIELIAAQYAKFKKLDFNSQINELLNDEYGYLLPEISGGQWEVLEVTLGQLIMPNEKYVKVLAKEIIDDYTNQLSSGKELIGGLYLPKNNYFRLIDGYHRLSALKQFFGNDHLVYIVSYQASPQV